MENKVSQRGIVRILAVLALGFCVLSFYNFHRYYADDAFISLRYARNFLNGHGLVWNPGERVEGYTNFLHVMLTSLLGSLGVDLMWASRLVGIGSFVALNLFIAWYMRHHMGGAKSSHRGWIPLLLTLTSLPLIIWCWGGLETLLFTLLCTVAIWTSLSRGTDSKGWVFSGVCFGLATMTRPNGVILFCLTGLFLLHKIFQERSRLRPLIHYTLAFALVYLPYFLWRLVYYGAFFPNTFYVRTVPLIYRLRTGLAYLISFLQLYSYNLLLPLTVVLLVYCYRKACWDARLSFLLSLIAVHIVYVVGVGGDFMAGFRFMVPILPTGALVLFLALEKACPLSGRRQAFIEEGLLFLLLTLQFAGPSVQIWEARWMDAPSFIGSIVGTYIDRQWPAGSLVALNTAGSTPYCASDLCFLDMLGVNDPVIARRNVETIILPAQQAMGHMKGDGPYVLSRKPDYIILGPAGGTAMRDVFFLTDYELSQSEAFSTNYRLRQVAIDVSDVPDYDRYEVLSTGVLIFRYYERIDTRPVP